MSITREEAINQLQDAEDGYEEYLSAEAIDMAIKALEQEDITWIVGNDNVQIAVRNMPVDMMQKINAIISNKQEPVLDKIRAEIAGLQTYFREMLIRDEVMQIIDKYKAESKD